MKVLSSNEAINSKNYEILIKRKINGTSVFENFYDML